MNTTSANPVVPLIGRVLLALIMVVYGVIKITSIPGTTGYMTKMGLPAPELFAWAAALIELVGGALLVIGWQTRKVAWFMVLYVVVATLIGHRFWDYEAAQRGAQMANFFKNLAIIGGFVLLANFGPGSASVDKS
ncbi:MAG TPA: DoxX family protein [Burkholderiales bacterium]|nr:DoxX family protein [Burkholderiales bacterium]